MFRSTRATAILSAGSLLLFALATPASALAAPVPSAAELRSVSLSSANPGLGVLAGGYFSRSVTLDGGASWQGLSGSSFTSDRFLAAAAAGASTRLVAGSDNSLSRASATGALTPAASIVGTVAGPMFTDVDMLDGSSGWAAGFGTSGTDSPGTVFKTTDGGANWTQQMAVAYHGPAGEPPEPGYDRVEFQGIDFLNANDGWVVGNQHTSNGSNATPWGVAYRTTDGGVTWSADAGYAAVSANLVNDCSFVDSENGWAVGAGGLIARRTAAGWASKGPAAATTYYGVKALSAQVVVVVGAAGTILRTSNADAATPTWTKVYPVVGTTDATERLRSVSFSDATHGLAAGENGLALSTADGGLSWQPVHGVNRLAGGDRYITAAAASRAAFPSATTVVIASGENFPDALAAAGLAGAYDAPILLVQKATLPSATSAEIARLKPAKVFVAGGTGVIDDATARAAMNAAGISAGTPIARLAGGTRYETAFEVAKQARIGGASSTTAFVVAGTDPYGALAVSPYAFSRKVPIILTNGAGIRPLGTTSALTGVTSAIAVGISAAQATAVHNQVETAGRPTEPLYGTGPSGLSVAAANVATSRGWADYGHVGIARDAVPVAPQLTKYLFPDALGGGPVVGRSHGVLLLTPLSSLSSPVSAALTSHKSAIGTGATNTYINEVDILGGTGAVSAAAETTIRNILKN